jgi:hypothetical protein
VLTNKPHECFVDKSGRLKRMVSAFAAELPDCNLAQFSLQLHHELVDAATRISLRRGRATFLIRFGRHVYIQSSNRLLAVPRHLFRDSRSGFQTTVARI